MRAASGGVAPWLIAAVGSGLIRAMGLVLLSVARDLVRQVDVLNDDLVGLVVHADELCHGISFRYGADAYGVEWCKRGKERDVLSLPVNKLTEDELVRAYREANGPFVAQAPSQEFVVMKLEDYAHLESSMSAFQRTMVQEDYAAAKRGDTVDARSALEEIRAAYGF